MVEIKTCPKRPPVTNAVHPPFGSVFSPHVLRMELHLDGSKGFHGEIKPMEPELFSPGAAVFHYGQSIFEGMKAFRQPDGTPGIFRPDLHATRFRKSAKRMVMADVPEEVFIECLKKFVDFEAESVPTLSDHSLYLRPVMFAADQKIKVGTSQKYLFYVMATIAGNYFGAGGTIKPARVMVNRQFVRAYPGGLGETKTAANYAASIWPQRLAAQRECDQVLYLDAVHHEYIDELGGMNFFVIRGNELVTPSLSGAILHGVTRKSILEIAKDLGLTAKEETLSFTELMKDIESGRVQETFACGTAAVVHPIGEILFQETLDSEPKNLKLKNPPTKSLEILEYLKKIQRGFVPQYTQWIERV